MRMSIHNVREVKIVDRKYRTDKFFTRCLKITDKDDNDYEITLFSKRINDVMFEIPETEIVK